MAKHLSEVLSDLSVSAKHTEEFVAAAQTEAHDKVVARRAKTQADVTAAIDELDVEVKAASDTASGYVSAIHAKVAADIEMLKANIARHRHDRDVRHAEDYANFMEIEAVFAVDYAVSSIKNAEVAILDAIVARLDFENTKAS